VTHWKVLIMTPDEADLGLALDDLQAILESKEPLHACIENFFLLHVGEVTERGVGFGQREIGVIVDDTTAHHLFLKYFETFSAANRHGLTKIFFWPIPPRNNQ